MSVCDRLSVCTRLGQDKPRFKMVVLGSGATGRSALTLKFVTGTFVEEYDPTIEDVFRKIVSIDGGEYIFVMFDQAGAAEYSANLDAFLKECDGILMVYDVTRRTSFEEVPIVSKYAADVIHSDPHQTDDAKDFSLRRSRKIDIDHIPFVLCGNKIDLADERKVEREEGKKLAEANGWLFIETSAKTGENVEEAFYTVFDTYRRNDNNSAANNSSKKCIIC